MSNGNSTLKKARSLALAALLVSAILSCSRKKGGYEITLDTSDPLAAAPDVQWALVVVPYASFKEKTSWDAQATGYCKQGECYQVLSRAVFTVEGETENWYRFEKGWLPESAVSVYPNKFRAKKAAESLK